MKNLFIIFSIIFLSFICNISLAQIGSWHQTLNGRNVWSLAKDPQGNVYAGGLTGVNSRIWKLVNGGGTWDTIYIGAGQTMWDFGFDSQGSIYVANFSNGLLKSTNNGLNFSVIPLSVFNNKNLQGVECGSNGYVFVTTSSGFFRSTDNGSTFNETALTGLNCLPVLVDKDSSNIVCVGVSSGTGVGIGFYRSIDYGLTFSDNLNPGKNGYNLYQRNNGDIYMITTTSPYNFDKSTNKGLTWTTLSNLPQVPRGITVSVLLPEFIYTAGNGGVFRSTDYGLSFNNINFTISSTPALYVYYNLIFMIFVGTTGATNGGVWMYHESYIQNINNENEKLSDYFLYQNYPNPFNPISIINYELRITNYVTLIVHDVLGNEVVTLVNGKQNTGSYEIIFDGENLPNGIYFYSLYIKGNKIDTKRMVLLK